METTSVRIPEEMKNGIDTINESFSGVFRRIVKQHLVEEMQGRCAVSGEVLYNDAYITLNNYVDVDGCVNCRSELNQILVGQDAFDGSSIHKIDPTETISLPYHDSIGSVLYATQRLYMQDITSTSDVIWDSLAHSLVSSNEITEYEIGASLLLWCDSNSPNHPLASCERIWHELSSETQEKLNNTKVTTLRDIIKHVKSTPVTEQVPERSVSSTNHSSSRESSQFINPNEAQHSVEMETATIDSVIDRESTIDADDATHKVKEFSDVYAHEDGADQSDTDEAVNVGKLLRSDEGEDEETSDAVEEDVD